MLLLGLGIPLFANSSPELPEESCKTFLTTLYDYYMFGNYDEFDGAVDALFTDHGKQRLSEEYEYDCEGVCYAFYALRTNSQDFKSAEENISRIESINHVEGNVYEVCYLDAGWSGCTLFLLAMDRGKVKVDDFVRHADEFNESLGIGADQVTLVFDANGSVEGKLLFTEGDHYITEMFDISEVPMEGRHLSTYRAEDGQGVLYTRRSRVNVRESPSTDSPVVAQLPTCRPGEEPQTFPCLGFDDGWYKIRIDGKVGYVRQDLVTWDWMHEFLER